MGDRFYGTADLIGWCQDRGWGYRLRLKGNLAVFDGDTRTTTQACAGSKRFYLKDVELTARRARTHIGIIHDPGHAEPWIVAMSDQPRYLSTLDYSRRWGIGSDVLRTSNRAGSASRDTQIRYPDRLDRLDPRHGPGSLLGGLYRSLGCRPSPNPGRKKRQQDQPRKLERGKTSWFTRGLRRIVKLLRSGLSLPPLWRILIN